MSRIAGVVLLYHPDDRLQERINSYLGQVEKLFVIDNSGIRAGQIKEHAKISYFNDGINGGIAARLNQAARLALAERFSWLLTMDQDSSFEGDNLDHYLNCVRTFPNPERVAVFGVQFDQPSQQHETCLPVQTLHLITSGSLINLHLFEKTGSFDEALFIDGVDYAYSFQAALQGFQTIQLQNIFLRHSLGTSASYFSFKTFRKTNRSLHPPIRIYYMTRNFFYLRKKYGDKFPREIRHIRKDLMNRLKNGLLYNPKRWSVLRSFVSGWLHYRQNRMGAKR